MFGDNYVSESEALQDWEDYDEEPTEEEYREKARDMAKSVADRKAKHTLNKSAKVGSKINCCCGCNRSFVKKSYQQVFFNNKGVDNCKDKYNNWVNDNRRFRMLAMTDQLQHSGEETHQGIMVDMMLDMKADTIKPTDNLTKSIIEKLTLEKCDSKTLKVIAVLLGIE